MSKNVIKWIVEEVDRTGRITFRETYEDSGEAFDVYKQLTERNKDTVVSVTRDTKRFLTE